MKAIGDTDTVPTTAAKVAYAFNLFAATVGCVSAYEKTSDTRRSGENVKLSSCKLN